jgi:propanol-preferring alcohol dehydrogenase
MRAMLLDAPRQALHAGDLPQPQAGPGELLIRVRACGVCRTDLHIVDADVVSSIRPLVLGHQIVGIVEAVGSNVQEWTPGVRVGVPWLGWTDGTCRYCASGRENLCLHARFTGCDIQGGYADYTVADARFCFPIPDEYDDLHAAPLLCAGLIGYRALRLCGDAPRLGLYGFGSSAHIVAQVARAQGRQVFAFTRDGDTHTQHFARSLGATWAGGSSEMPPEPLDAAIIFAAVGALVPTALRAVDRGGTVVCAGIHMSEIPSFSYEILWGERMVRSVANLTRQDGVEFLPLAAQAGVRLQVQVFPLADAQRALDQLRAGRIEGSAVLAVDPGLR